MDEKVYVNLDALKSLDIKCKDCNTTVHYPLNQPKAKRLLYECPSCHKPWMKPHGDADCFIRNLAKWKLVMGKEGSNLGVELRLVIDKCE